MKTTAYDSLKINQILIKINENLKTGNSVILKIAYLISALFELCCSNFAVRIIFPFWFWLVQVSVISPPLVANANKFDLYTSSACVEVVDLLVKEFLLKSFFPSK